jgi:hypothetical protein
MIPDEIVVSISSSIKDKLESEQNLDSYNAAPYWNLCKYRNVQSNKTAYGKTSNRCDVFPIKCLVVTLWSFCPKLYV